MYCWVIPFSQKLSSGAQRLLPLHFYPANEIARQAYGAISIRQTAVELEEARAARRRRGAVGPAASCLSANSLITHRNYALATPLWTLDNTIAPRIPKLLKT